MIEFTPGGYDKNVKQIQAEARAALLYEIDTAMRDLQAAAVTAGGSYTLPEALEIAFDMLRQGSRSCPPPRTTSPASAARNATRRPASRTRRGVRPLVPINLEFF